MLRGHHLLFGLALAQGAVSLLAWVFGVAPGTGGAAWHAHELIFGQALAVVAGYLLTRTSPRALLTVASLWLAARSAAMIPATPEALRAVLSVAATAAITGPAVQGFLRGAKRAGNLVFPVLVGSFAVADALFQLGAMEIWPGGLEVGVYLALGLVVLLMAAMGGRLLGAAASGAAQRAGGARIAPQPVLERVLLATTALGFLAEAFAAPTPLAAPLLAGGGAIFTLRVVLWAPGLRHSNGDVVALAAGQTWLGLGLLAWAAAMAGLPLPERSALHLLTIGGIGGTLLVMMMRSAAQREGRPMPRRAAPIVAGLMGTAALVRALAPPEWGWPAAAVLWSAATLVAAVAVFRNPRA
jgi:uncharacterized protein involved in response to NO